MPASSPTPATSRPRSTGGRSRAAAAPSAYAERPWLRSYPEGVPADHDFPSVPLTRLLDDAAASYPTATALVFLGTRITYRELKEQVDSFAAVLARLGVTKGDRVALVLPNCPQNVIAFYATLRLGAIVVENNPLYTEAEMVHQLTDCGAKVVICLDKTFETVQAVRDRTHVQHVIVTSIADYLPRSAQLKLRLPVAKAKRMRRELTAPVPKGANVKQFMTLLRSAGMPARQTPIDPAQDLALLQYTGGTTGLSKGAMLTHANLVANAWQNRLWLTDAQPGREVTLGVLPLFHAYGLTVCMNTSILLAGSLVLLPRFDLDLVFAAIDEHKPTLFPGVPPIYRALIDSPKSKSHDLRSIRACISGAMKLPADTQEQFEKLTGGTLVEGYGMTETSPSTHANPIKGTRKPGSIGLPLTGTECRIVDQNDATRDVPPGEAGELAIRGPQVFRGYWGREDQDGIFTADGYLLTGDIAVMDDDGYFAIVDRKKELIIAGGFNIYPSEVEEVLLGIPGVADAAVIGVPDRYRGETVKAFVVVKDGFTLSADSVMQQAAAALTPYKVPKLVEFRDELPRTTVGKVLRRTLLEEELAKAPAADRDAAPARTTPGGRSSAPASTPSEAAPAPKKAAATKKATRSTPAKKAVSAPKSAGAKKTAAKKATTKSAGTKTAAKKTTPKSAGTKAASAAKTAKTAKTAKKAAPRKRSGTS